jgi:hypothetical protein
VPPQPDPDPDPEPEPPDPLPDPPLPEVENDAEAYGVTIVPAVVAAGETYWRIVRVHHLTGAENSGNHNLYMDALDRDGSRINGIVLAVRYPDGRQVTATVDKPPTEPGTNVPLFKNDVVSAWVQSELSSDRVENVHTAHADEPPGNTLYHHSFLVEWQVADAPELEPEPPPEPDPEPQPVTEDDIRHAAWNEADLPWNPTAALQAYARAHDLGAPLTDEFDVNDAVRVQGFVGAILWCVIGDWANIHELEW